MSDKAIPVWRQQTPTPAPSAACEAHEVVIVGAGPVGLTLALDLARRGRRVTVLNRLSFIAAGSKAICFSKRTLDIWNRLGVGGTLRAAGVGWDVGKVFWREGAEPLYAFDLQPIKDQAMPAFINLAQYCAEAVLVDALSEHPAAQIRWGHEVVGLGRDGAQTRLSVRAPDGDYDIDADWVLACDGSRSTVRTLMGLDFEGRVFDETFLIADVRMSAERPAERWFWFDPPFNPRRSVLLHKQPDDIWRIDFQLGADVDPQMALSADAIETMIRGLLGPDIAFAVHWTSLYRFQCRRMRRFRHGPVIFLGDAAHLVSPFGARGCNGGVADADNLAWKLDLVLRGEADEALLDSYDIEARAAADENILNSARATDFMTPKSSAAEGFRDAVLELAGAFDFARPFVNSGRLSVAVPYTASPLSTPDAPGELWAGGLPPGSPPLDAPVGDGWLLQRLGQDFAVLTNGWSGPPPEGARLVDVRDLPGEEIVAARWGLSPGAAYLVRPDQYVAARWKRPTPAAVHAALKRALGQTQTAGRP